MKDHSRRGLLHHSLFSESWKGEIQQEINSGNGLQYNLVGNWQQCGSWPSQEQSTPAGSKAFSGSVEINMKRPKWTEVGIGKALCPQVGQILFSTLNVLCSCSGPEKSHNSKTVWDTLLCNFLCFFFCNFSCLAQLDYCQGCALHLLNHLAWFLESSSLKNISDCIYSVTTFGPFILHLLPLQSVHEATSKSHVRINVALPFTSLLVGLRKSNSMHQFPHLYNLMWKPTICSPELLWKNKLMWST